MRQRSTTINVLFPQWVKFIIILETYFGKDV